MSRTRPLRLALACLVLGVVACQPRLSSITVDVQTDLAPGLELGLLEIEVLEGHVPVGTSAVRTRRTAAMPQPSEAGEYQRGRRIAQLGGLDPGPYTVRVVGRRPAPPGAPEDSGTLLAERRVVIVLDDDRVVRAVLGSSCVGVTCPGSEGSSTASQCLNGRCVEPGCDPSRPSTSRECCAGIDCADLALCATDDDCDAAPCAVPRCVSGACIAEDRPGACAGDEYCDRSARACLPGPRAARPDAGAPDAPRPEATDAWLAPGEDAAALDASACPAERCDNGIDDDCDGGTDCADLDCLGTRCDDGDACTHDDACDGSVCAGARIECSSTECMTRACNGSSSCTETPRAGACGDDGSPCTADVCAAGRCSHPAMADGATCPGGLRCCGGACVDTRVHERHCGVCGVDCGSRACIAGACRCESNAECRTFGYGSSATCYDQSDGNGLRCQCICNPDSAWRGTCAECPGAAQCDQRAGLNLCFFP